MKYLRSWLEQMENKSQFIKANHQWRNKKKKMVKIIRKITKMMISKGSNSQSQSGNK